MFYNCTNLESLDISNFNTLKVNGTINEIFTNCSSLKYINLLNYNGRDIFDTISNYDNLKICINDYNQIDNGNNTLKKLNVKITCDEDVSKTSKGISKNNFKIFIYPLIAFILILLFILLI